jgi:hypothetical protein
MKTQKILIGTLVAGVAMLFLGWLIYGKLLADYMHENCDSSSARPMEQMVWWAMIASNLVWGLLLALILNWSGSNGAMSGAKTGVIVGFLAALGFDLGMYSMTTMFTNHNVIIVDSLAYAVLFAVSGLLAGWIMGKVGASKA